MSYFLQLEKTMTMFMMWMIMFLITFFLMAYLIMVSYNNSVPKMSDQHKIIDYETAVWFTLLICIIAIYFKCNCGMSWKSLKN
jgi:hypothetical protein